MIRTIIIVEIKHIFPLKIINTANYSYKTKEQNIFSIKLISLSLVSWLYLLYLSHHVLSTWVFSNKEEAWKGTSRTCGCKG